MCICPALRLLCGGREREIGRFGARSALKRWMRSCWRGLTWAEKAESWRFNITKLKMRIWPLMQLLVPDLPTNLPKLLLNSPNSLLLLPSLAVFSHYASRQCLLSQELPPLLTLPPSYPSHWQLRPLPRSQGPIQVPSPHLPSLLFHCKGVCSV